MESAKDTREEFRYQFIEAGWFDYDRVKTMSAMQRLWERVPQDDLDKFAGVAVFAPSAEIAGQAFPSGPNVARPWIYLSPTLESKNQTEVDSTVAHEFAHIVLGHCDSSNRGSLSAPAGLRHDEIPGEREVDALICRWGFQSLAKTKS